MHRRHVAADAKLADQAGQFLSLAFKTVAGRTRLLDHRRVLLRHLVHLVDRAVDLVQPGRLLLRRGGDVGDEAVDLAPSAR